MLELKHVSKTFNPGTEDAKTALDDLSLSVADGDFITIIGANGAGKSTLFGAICGTFLTDSGSIFLDGENITMQPQHRRSRVIGHLFQDPMRGSAPGMSIEENLALAAGRGGWLSHVSKADKAAFRDRLALLGMGLENRMKQPVGLLSGGQRQALTLLMATINPPKLLLLDEPVTGLDPVATGELYNLIKLVNLCNDITVIMVTHDIDAALRYATHVLHLGHQQLFFGTAAEYKQSDAARRFLGGRKL